MMHVDNEAAKGAEAKHIEAIQDSLIRGHPVHYQPRTDDDRRLDKRVNLKLDVFVVTILALGFIVSLQVPGWGLWKTTLNIDEF
jgi:hypothetical protein